MKKQISFTTDIFETKRTNPDKAAEYHFGEDLAKWFAEAAAGGEFDFGTPYQADWGWAVEATAGDEKFLIKCEIMNESIDDDQADWIIAVEKVTKWKLFGSKDSQMRSELCDLIQNVLREKPHIREIRWTDQAGHFAPKNLA